jgi:hypothetical protein
MLSQSHFGTSQNLLLSLVGHLNMDTPRKVTVFWRYDILLERFLLEPQEEDREGHCGA